MNLNKKTKIYFFFLILFPMIFTIFTVPKAQCTVYPSNLTIDENLMRIEFEDPGEGVNFVLASPTFESYQITSTIVDGDIARINSKVTCTLYPIIYTDLTHESCVDYTEQVFLADWLKLNIAKHPLLGGWTTETFTGSFNAYTNGQKWSFSEVNNGDAGWVLVNGLPSLIYMEEPDISEKGHGFSGDLELTRADFSLPYEMQGDNYLIDDVEFTSSLSAITVIDTQTINDFADYNIQIEKVGETEFSAFAEPGNGPGSSAQEAADELEHWIENEGIGIWRKEQYTETVQSEAQFTEVMGRKLYEVGDTIHLTVQPEIEFIYEPVEVLYNWVYVDIVDDWWDTRGAIKEHGITSGPLFNRRVVGWRVTNLAQKWAMRVEFNVQTNCEIKNFDGVPITANIPKAELGDVIMASLIGGEVTANVSFDQGFTLWDYSWIIYVIVAIVIVIFVMRLRRGNGSIRISLFNRGSN